MKITIDTKEDSHAEIKKIIRMLSSLVGSEEIMSNQGDVFSDDSEESSEQKSPGVFSMFGSTEEQSEDIEIEPKEAEKVDIPDLEEYED